MENELKIVLSNLYLMLNSVRKPIQIELTELSSNTVRRGVIAGSSKDVNDLFEPVKDILEYVEKYKIEGLYAISFSYEKPSRIRYEEEINRGVTSTSDKRKTIGYIEVVSGFFNFDCYDGSKKFKKSVEAVKSLITSARRSSHLSV